MTFLLLFKKKRTLRTDTVQRVENITESELGQPDRRGRGRCLGGQTAQYIHTAANKRKRKTVE